MFARSERLSRFLTFVVEHTLAGKADCLKEYVLGAEALGRGVTFDPRTDTSVRVHARRLRSALTEYYAGAGKHEQIIISIPPGGYAPSFHRRQGTVQGIDKPRRKTAATAVTALAMVASFGWWWMQLRSPSTPISSIAVLPFVDLSPETLPEYFCDGLTEEIISALSRTEDLPVVARTSAFQFKGKPPICARQDANSGPTPCWKGAFEKPGHDCESLLSW